MCFCEDGPLLGQACLVVACTLGWFVLPIFLMWIAVAVDVVLFIDGCEHQQAEPEIPAVCMMIKESPVHRGP
jgi:hypothetical protein